MYQETEITYTLVESLCTTQGAIGKVVYGIQGHYRLHGKPKICTVADVSPDRAKVERLVEILSRLQPSPDILPDIVEDYLVELYDCTV